MILAFALAVSIGPRLFIAGAAVLLAVVGMVVRVVASRRIRAEQAGLVYLLGARLATAEAARQRDAEILHELRSTVQGVSSASRLLTDRGDELSAEIAQRLESMRQTELARLERMLTMTGPARSGPVSIDDVVRPLVDSIELRGHHVSWQPTGTTAVGRPDDVAEIVHVLLENAVRHAPGSRIRLTADRTQDRVTITVADTGPGVPTALRHLVFDRGVRSSTSVGQGIGLNAALRLAHEMDGDLRLADSWSTTGATFILDLPAAAVDASTELPCHARSA